jgi:AraC family transcriptional regulator
MQTAVERAIKTMWERYEEPLTLDQLADAAILSRFYFSRVFRTITGTSPGRFLSAIRLYKAKDLLLETSLSVTDISYRVGYNSLGTFTSRFTWSVGFSPARYRGLSMVNVPAAFVPAQRNRDNDGSIYGTLNLPDSETPSRVYVATFDSPFAQGVPTSCAIIERTTSYRLDAAPGKELFIRAAALGDSDIDTNPRHRKPAFVGGCPAMTLHSHRKVNIDIDLHPLRNIDLPVLLALPELDSRQLVDALA